MAVGAGKRCWLVTVCSLNLPYLVLTAEKKTPPPPPPTIKKSLASRIPCCVQHHSGCKKHYLSCNLVNTQKSLTVNLWLNHSTNDRRLQVFGKQSYLETFWVSILIFNVVIMILNSKLTKKNNFDRYQEIKKIQFSPTRLAGVLHISLSSWCHWTNKKLLLTSSIDSLQVLAKLF